MNANRHRRTPDPARDAALDLIGKIADRAVSVFALYETRVNRMDIVMDITACHFSAQKLRLDDLLAADDFNFIHDVGGINRHLDRDTFKLTGGFSPRFSARG